ncbi:hypothetical protein HDU89_005654 [Geranomyces variabilis]|nr:hypothetical protein HDU89_005654 [Geranomyces variabilis]
MTSDPTTTARDRRRRSRSVSPPPLEVIDDADSPPINAPPTSPADSDVGEHQHQKRHSSSGASTAKKTLAAASSATPTTTLSASRPAPPPISTSTARTAATSTTTSPPSASDSNTSAASSASVLSAAAAAAAEPPTISSPRPSATTTSTTQKRRKRQYYLRITISAAKRGALPGYEGDRRVEWAVSDDAASLTESAERTRDALGTLKAFWDDVAPEELGFSEFAWCVFGEEFAPDAAATPATGAGAAASASEVDVTASMAARLAGNTMALSAFLADVRDWDAFRLLIRRRAGRLPVSLAARGHERRKRAREASSSVDGSAGAPASGAATAPATGLRDEAVRMLASEAFFYVLAEKEAEWDAQRAQLETALAAAERKVQRIVHSVTGALGGAIGEIPLHRTAQRTDSVVRRSLESIRVANIITSSGQGPTTSATTLGSSRRAAVGGTTVRNVSLDGGSRPVRRATSHNHHQQHDVNQRLNKKVSFDLDTLRREDVKDSLLSRGSNSASADSTVIPALSISAPAHAPPSPAPTLITPRTATSTPASAIHPRRRDSDISITKTDSPTTAPADSAWRDLDTTTPSSPHSASSSSSSGRHRARLGSDSDDSAEDTIDSSGGTDSEHDNVHNDRFDEHDFEDARKSKRLSDDSATRGRRRHDDGNSERGRAGHGYSSSSSSTSSATATVGGGGGGRGGAGGLYRFDNTAFVPTSDPSPTVTPRTSTDGAAAATTAATPTTPSSTRRHSKCLDFARPRRSAEVRREEQAAAAASVAAGGTSSSPPAAKEANAVRKLGRYLRSKVSRDSFK